MRLDEEEATHDDDVRASVALMEGDSELMTLFFQHISVCPPHGPFEHYSALTFTQRVARWLQQGGAAGRNDELQRAVTPTAVLQLIGKYYNTEHLKSWPLLYVPSQICVKDVEALMEKFGDRDNTEKND
ncbi:hypothetical protein ERJ75_001227900 [Trypanosoma vivax]|uniref:Uncharacterized protein n=1 Tax=Trypanosoma vivax (strain Y486) TaxID=1055687 RepID=G0U1C8_TRYVY|nr:hypothetical protein TRVL_02878 [Trypanosoma vivax]KAH8608917.1 hypothetical protein ERJ75_001227900 [Trypanosoma vivax]CCC49883.1 conserved hypothetical protein, fragment [Trypanosoma vivax Y486]